MKKIILTAIISVFSIGMTTAQVGINTTSPNAQLDIRSTNQVTPANTDGVLIPKIDAFPVTNPTAAQQGMLVYRTTLFGTNPPGFYYWNNPTTTWIPILSGTSAGGTLDQAYDFGGPGSGRTITADNGAVTINGNDGLVSNGTFGSGTLAPTGPGVKMFWNPRKAAFRAGEIGGTQWNDAFIGRASAAFGQSNASGNYAAAFGNGNDSSGESSFSTGMSNVASGYVATVFGLENVASGNHATAFGLETVASGTASTAFGFGNDALGSYSMATGHENSARSFAETALGIGATNYSLSPAGDTEFTPFNELDRLVVVGNAIDSNFNTIVDAAERRDALVILKNGLTRLPSTTNAMITASDGKAVVTKEWVQANATSGGTLDSAYDFGGSGAGRTITADAGAVTINGTDGLVSTGIINTGALAPTGAGVKMFWNPRKAAFRAGQVSGAAWDNVNIGINSTSFGQDNQAIGEASSAFGIDNLASGNYSTAFGQNNTTTGISSTAFGGGNQTNGYGSTAFGATTIANGSYSTTFGIMSQSNGVVSTTFGRQNVAQSFGETVLGIGATLYTPSASGAIAFSPGTGSDRLLVVGNAIDANMNTAVDPAERSDALIILKNGLTRLPSTTNAMITSADGKAVVTKEWVQANTAGTLDSAYDFGGAGLGRTITADTGAVTINGTDGLVVTGTPNTGAISPAGAGTRMVWNPRKAAFRAGQTSGTSWDNTNVGAWSAAFGNNNMVSGAASTSFGTDNIVSGQHALVSGENNTVNGFYANAFGYDNNVSQNNSSAFGNNNTISGQNSIAFGSGNILNGGSYRYAMGNSNTVNGNYSIAVGQGNQLLLFDHTRAFGSNNTVNGTQSTAFGSNNSVSGQCSFVAGLSNDLNDDFSFAFGNSNVLNGRQTTVFGFTNNVTGIEATVFGTDNNAIGIKSVIFGRENLADGFESKIFGHHDLVYGINGVAFGSYNEVNGEEAASFGNNNFANGTYSVTFGKENETNGLQAAVFGHKNTAFAANSLAMGHENTASSFAETVLGIGATTYTPSTFGAVRFAPANATDRLFVVGNAIDTNLNTIVDTAERSDALMILKNGNTGIGSSSPQERLHVNGSIRMVDGNQAAGRLMVSDANGTASWQTITLGNAWSTIGNAGMDANNNFVGTTTSVDLIFRRNNVRAGRLGTSNTSFGLNALNPTTTGAQNTAIGLNALGSNTAGLDNTALGWGALWDNLTGDFNTASGRAALQANVDGSNNSGFGYQALRNNASGTGNTAHGRASLFANLTGDNNTALGFNAFNTGTNFSNSTAVGFSSVITGSNQVRIGNNAVTSIGGFAGWTNVSDGRFKKEVRENVPGLRFIKRLTPVTYKLDMNAMATFLNIPMENRNLTDEQSKGNSLQTGFIAQDVERVARSLDFEFSGIDAPKNSSDHYGLRYAEFVVPLVKAVQEQQDIIETQKEELQLLKTQYTELLRRLEVVERK